MIATEYEYPASQWKPFTELPDVDDGIGPSGSHLWIYYKKEGYIADYINWNNWSTKKDQEQHIKDGDLWTYMIKPLPPKE